MISVRPEDRAYSVARLPETMLLPSRGMLDVMPMQRIGLRGSEWAMAVRRFFIALAKGENGTSIATRKL
jgi:hypothetical protein